MRPEVIALTADTFRLGRREIPLYKEGTEMVSRPVTYLR